MVEPLKLWVKSGKTRHQNPLFGHIRDEISKNRGGKKKYWTSRGHETQFSSKFGDELSLPYPFFS
jgi:hypothetical protein